MSICNQMCRRRPCEKLRHRGYPRRDQTPNGLTPIRIDVRADSNKKPTLGIHQNEKIWTAIDRLHAKVSD
ncbi:hypothetical protein [Nocardia cyriacigeorgica]|uniref:Uncharacterized protein n=2 Tax=Nocardia cyriacigeorgica TaxID=135487 RepID=A0A5R8N9P5_9NOCA|nr:hypothetical protein [Nocardia cyriacigeorgica]TLF72424.1 hypothetical protein FEK34_29155 [Nocardia cyriacigeorgica]BDT87394.1 hypothetical protein FMUAM8_31580 [Nocardia cyriacigeorgica]